MIWSDNDVANDFTTLKDKDGNQAYSPEFLRAGIKVEWSCPCRAPPL